MAVKGNFALTRPSATLSPIRLSRRKMSLAGERGCRGPFPYFRTGQTSSQVRPSPPIQ